MQAANAELVSTAHSINDSVSASLGLLLNSPYEVAKGAQSAVKLLKGVNLYNEAVKQM